jgi:enolase
MDTIAHLEGREILSGAGRPTVEARLITAKGVKVTASVPSGTSKGKYEAYELYDGGKRYRGRGVRKAAENIARHIAPALIGKDVTDQQNIDRTLIELDGTPNKRRLGGNAVLAASVASVKAGAESSGVSCYRYIGGIGATRLPSPLATVIAGGKHSPSNLDFEDYLLILNGFGAFSEALAALVETRRVLEEILVKKFGPVPDEGGALSPPIRDTCEAFDVMLRAVERAGFAGCIRLGLDVAASDLYLAKKKAYRVCGKEMQTDELIDYFTRLSKAYPLVFIEDPFHQDDFRSFARLTSALPGIQIVGDDLFTTNPRRLKKGIAMTACNTMLFKVNQVGTVTEACDAGLMAVSNGYGVSVSLRSSDTNDSFIADLAVGIGAQQIKLGSPVRGERNAKYNRLLEIEAELDKGARFEGKIRGT